MRRNRISVIRYRISGSKRDRGGGCCSGFVFDGEGIAREKEKEKGFITEIGKR